VRGCVVCSNGAFVRVAVSCFRWQCPGWPSVVADGAAAVLTWSVQHAVMFCVSVSWAMQAGERLPHASLTHMHRLRLPAFDSCLPCYAMPCLRCLQDS
jgi:hypothetical protein